MSKKKTNSCGCIILAAGASSRMGYPKQLLEYQGKTLLRHTIHEAMQVLPQQLIVVLGAHAEKIAPSISDLPVHIVSNPHWETGMGSSIRAGMQELNSEIDSVLLLVSDQPFISGKKLDEMLRQLAHSPQSIAAAVYEDTVGVPAIFDRKYFPFLANMEGKGGAKQLLNRFSTEVLTIPFAQGAIDIDTPEDYQKLP